VLDLPGSFSISFQVCVNVKLSHSYRIVLNGLADSNPSSDQPSVSVLSRLLAHAPGMPCRKMPEDITSSQSEYTFRRQLKTWLFKKSFPDVII